MPSCVWQFIFGPPNVPARHSVLPIDPGILPLSGVSVVKNGFSDLTKVQIGWDQIRTDVMNALQRKALKEGCCERE